jgi:glycosyltransferase involved in cell wall biosynthesis
MKICMICPTYPPNDVPCGVGDYTRELTEHVAALGPSVTVVASTGHHAHSDARVPVVRLTDRWDRAAVRALRRRLTSERFDAVHIQYTPELYGRGPWMKLLPAWLGLGGGPPVVLAAHTLVGGYRTARMLAPLLVAASRRVICPNAEAAALIRRHLPMFGSRVREIPIGSSIPPHDERRRDEVRNAVRAELGLGVDTVLLAHFGFAYPGKGIETLLDAARRLSADGVKFVLLMIGGAWPGAEDYYDALRETSRASALGDHVRWLGHAHDLRVSAWLTAADIYVLPYDDGISARRSTLMAGIANRLPIVSTHARTPDSRFRDGDHLRLVPPRDPAALAAALAELARSPELRRRLEAGIADVGRQFAWPAIAAATIAVYREVAR